MKHTPLERPIQALGAPLRTLHRIETERTTSKIVRESAGILILASVISSVGGLALEGVRGKLIAFLPILILVPAMNEMIGGFGAVVASRFTTMLSAGHVARRAWWRSPALQSLFMTVLGTAMIVSIYMAVVSYVIAMVKGFAFHPLLVAQLVAVSVLATLVLVGIIFAVSITGGLYVHKKGHDPDNYLIPLATGIADLGSMLVLALVLVWLF